jgi:hypothetical protein
MIVRSVAPVGAQQLADGGAADVGVVKPTDGAHPSAW